MVEVLIGPSSIELGIKVAQELNLKHTLVESKIFPDGESYIRIPEEKIDKELILIQSTHPPQNKHLIELFLMLDAAKDLGVEKIIAVIPYLAYARQDKRFRPGEAISVKVLAKLIKEAGADKFITFNIHKEKILDFFNIESINLSGGPAIGDYFLQKRVINPYVVAPDEGAYYLALEVSKILNCECTYFEKKRDKVTGVVKTEFKKLDVKNKTVIIVDDIISTGSTIINVAEILKTQNVKKIYATCIHPLLIGDAQNKMKTAGIDEILGTDCIPSEVSKISVSKILAEALKKEL
ncbi:MAG: ribose-phosphate diphosphokinase [Candidatus Bathyarchaeia archaeon]|nr:ribose-phosphate diphosphokinase [Candidatus Bathyarchaeota archaeon]